MDIFKNKNVLGADEVGTGEVLRPSVFVSCFIPLEQISILEEIGIKDSKKISRKKCVGLGKELTKIVKYEYYILTNEELNKMYEKYPNLNQIKAIIHNKVIEKLFNKCKNNVDFIILDAFCSKENYLKYLNKKQIRDNFLFIEQGKTASIAVACASVIATYLEEEILNQIESELGAPLPGGNTSLALEFAKERYKNDKKFLNKYAKKCFYTIKKIELENK